MNIASLLNSNSADTAAEPLGHSLPASNSDSSGDGWEHSPNMNIASLLNSKSADAAGEPLGHPLPATNPNNSVDGWEHSPQHSGIGVNTPVHHKDSHSGRPELQRILPKASGKDNVAGRKSFVCSSCGKSFSRRGELVRHERIDGVPGPFVCNHPGCGTKISSKCRWTAHARAHRGGKHICETCKLGFSTSSALIQHRQTHSDKLLDCPYASCPKKYKHRKSMARHQKMHEAAAATAEALANRIGLGRGGLLSGQEWQAVLSQRLLTFGIDLM